MQASKQNQAQSLLSGNDYVGQHHPLVSAGERLRLMLTAEASFLASLELRRNDLVSWELLLKESK